MSTPATTSDAYHTDNPSETAVTPVIVLDPPDSGCTPDDSDSSVCISVPDSDNAPDSSIPNVCPPVPFTDDHALDTELDATSSATSRPATAASRPKSKQSQFFRSGWKTNRHWLLNVEGEGMYCQLCQKHDACPFDKTTWNTTPCTRMRLGSVKDHEDTDAHKTSVRKELQSSLTSVTQRMNPEISQNALEQAFCCLYFLCKQKIAHTTNYEPLLDLLVHMGVNIKARIRVGQNATYTSDKSIQDILYCLSESLETDILDEVRAARHFSVMFDESTDCSVVEQMVIHL